MIASLYHSGSASAVAAITRGRGYPTFILGTLQPPETERQFRGIEPNVLVLAIPCEILTTHQVCCPDRGLVRQAELPQRHLDRRFLCDVGIKADGDQDHAAVQAITFSVQNDLVVEGIVKYQAPMRLQRRMPAADPVQC